MEQPKPCQRRSEEARPGACRRLLAKIREMQAMQRTLEDLARRCHGDERPECPILDDLAMSHDCGKPIGENLLPPFTAPVPGPPGPKVK